MYGQSIRKLARDSGRAAAEQQVTAEVALHLGSAIANIAAVYDPDAVILLGEAFLPVRRSDSPNIARRSSLGPSTCEYRNWAKTRR